MAARDAGVDQLPFAVEQYQCGDAPCACWTLNYNRVRSFLVGNQSLDAVSLWALAKCIPAQFL